MFSPTFIIYKVDYITHSRQSSGRHLKFSAAWRWGRPKIVCSMNIRLKDMTDKTHPIKIYVSIIILSSYMTIYKLPQERKSLKSKIVLSNGASIFLRIFKRLREIKIILAKMDDLLWRKSNNKESVEFWCKLFYKKQSQNILIISAQTSKSYSVVLRDQCVQFWAQKSACALRSMAS